MTNNNNQERLHKYIANCGYCSRRHAELLVEAKLVKIDGVTVLEAGVKVSPRNVITINGDIIEPPERFTIMLNKPANFITSTSDSHERLTVMDLLPRKYGILGVVPVGRLDFETEGLLLLSNDGDINHQLTHPSFECEKEYFVQAKGSLSKKQMDRLKDGSLSVEGSLVQPAQIINAKLVNGNTEFHMIIHEGKKRQIRRMVEAVSSEVLYLKRIRVGSLKLDALPLGDHKVLNASEIKHLFDHH
jgi:23S rRNA pseudouridine2605 synthase